MPAAVSIDRTPDEVGIVRFRSGDSPWPGVPDPLTAAVMTADADADAEVAAVLRKRPATLQRRLLHPDAGAVACLLPLHRGSRVLDLASPSGATSVALMSLGAAVTRGDWCYARLRYAQIMQLPRPEAAVHLDPAEPLPFPDGSFDIVLAEVGDLPVALAALLRELHRVLASDGTLAVASGGQQPPSGRSARARNTVRDAGQGRRLGAAARAAGFGGARRFAELSAGGESRQLVRIEDARRILARPRPAAGSRGRMVSRGRAVAARAGLSGLLVPRHLVLARADGEPPVGVVESLPELSGVPLPPVLTLSDARVALIAPDAVVKVAISDRERQGLANEVARTDAARSSALGRYVVAWSRLRTEASATYAVFPRVRHRPPTSLAEIDAVLAAALAAQPGTDAPWGETALWRRLDSARGRADVDEIGAEDLLRHALDLGPDRRLPTGTTHGDLHGGNVLLATDGSPVLIDWNRSEPDNPLLLDAVYAAVRQHSRRTGASLARSLESFVDGQLTGPLAEQSATSLGELTPLDAAVLLVLDRVASYSRPRRRYKPWTMAPLQQAVAAVTAQTAPST